MNENYFLLKGCTENGFDSSTNMFESVSDLCEYSEKNLDSIFLTETRLLPATLRNKERKIVHKPTLVHYFCYDFIGNWIKNKKKEEDLIDDIFSNLTYTDTCQLIQMACQTQGVETSIALLQLNQDRLNEEGFFEIGVWLDQVLRGKTADQVISGDKLQSLSRKLVERLLMHAIPKAKGIDVDYLLLNLGLTISELGILLLNATFNEYVEEVGKISLGYHYECDIMPIFVPNFYYGNTPKNEKYTSIHPIDGDDHLMKQIILSTMVCNQVERLVVDGWTKFPMTPRLVIVGDKKLLYFKLSYLEYNICLSDPTPKTLENIQFLCFNLFSSMLYMNKNPLMRCINFKLKKFISKFYKSKNLRVKRDDIFFLPSLDIYSLENDIEEQFTNTKSNLDDDDDVDDKLLKKMFSVIDQGSKFVKYVLKK